MASQGSGMQTAVPSVRYDESRRAGNVGYTHYGTGAFVNQSIIPQRGATVMSESSFSLNFVNADIATVAKSVLGDILHQNFSIDPKAQGTITLRSIEPVTMSNVLPMFEEGLRMNNLGLIQTPTGYRIESLATISQHGVPMAQSGPGNLSAGYGTDIVQLRYISASDVLKTVGPMIEGDGQVRPDIQRNILYVTGSSSERAAVEESISLLDVDYMKGMSFALIPLNIASPSQISSELSEVMHTKSGPMEGMVQILPIDRLRSILVISAQPRYVSEAQAWIARLDRALQGVARHTFVYEVQNGRAKDLADVLSRLMASENGQSVDASQGELVPLASDTIPKMLSGLGGGAPQGQMPTQASTGLPSPLLGGLPGPRTGEAASETKPHVIADEISNALLFTGTDVEYSEIVGVLRRLDVPQLEVVLEAVIAEVTLTDQLQYGVQFYFSDSHNQLFNTTGSEAIAPTVPGFAYTFIANKNTKVILDALSSVTKVNVVSAPKLLVLNNQAARLDVGNDVPVATEAAQSTITNNAPIVNAIQYRETGVILNVTPRANQSGVIQMDISQEVSDVAQTTSSTLNSPTFDERKISSTVSVNDGDTVALGGLITDNKTHGNGGIPYLKDLPVLGTLFSNRTANDTRTELLVLITPHLIHAPSNLLLFTQELRSQMKGVQALLPH